MTTTISDILAAFICREPEIGPERCQKACNKGDAVQGLIGLTDQFLLTAPLYFTEKLFASIKLLKADVKVIKSGSQSACIGNVDVDKAQDICAMLNRDSEDDVKFRAYKVSMSIHGGTCSAMAFEFADRYLKAREAGLSAEQTIDRLSPDFKTSNLEFRTRQSAFNTIYKSKQTAGDFKKAKIASMLRFHQRKVVQASDCFDLDTLYSLKNIEEILQEFQRGVFVIRCISEDNSEKGESHGHSMVLIREDGKNYFYNPGTGVSELDPNYPAGALYKELRKINRQFDIPLGRIYQIV